MKANHIKTVVQKIFILLFVTFFFYSCKGPQSPEKKEAIKNSTAPTIQYKKPPSGFNDTLTVNSSSAVFFNPDSVQLEKIKAVMKKELYETEVHNCFYLFRNARRVLKQYWPQIHIIEASRVRYLLFVKSDKGKILIDLNTKNDMCGIFLFNRKKDPELIDMMNIDTALRFYFK